VVKHREEEKEEEKEELKEGKEEGTEDEGGRDESQESSIQMGNNYFYSNLPYKI
jgi:hypothetical protein